MNTKKTMHGHLMALFTMLIWGTTFISTKILLDDFTPIEILFFRFCLGLTILVLIFPKRLKGTNLRQELMFAAAGLCGVTMYFLLENIALTYTLVSNVGVILSVAPIFTAILSHWFLDEEKLNINLFIGFIIAILGIALINFNGRIVLNLNPLGDLLAVLAAAVWAVYSVFIKKISAFGYNTIQTTRRTFFYGLVFMLPALLIFPFQLGLERFSKPENLFNILYLGLGASAICFVTWNAAVRILGAVKTSIYIYIGPAITIVTSIIVLNEKITWIAACGTLLTLTGLFVSERKHKSEKMSRSQAKP